MDFDLFFKLVMALDASANVNKNSSHTIGKAGMCMLTVLKKQG